MGAAGAAAGPASAAGTPVERSPAGDQRDLLPHPDRGPVARLPERFGNWKTVYNRHRRWSADGTWETILGALRSDPGDGPGAAPPRRPAPPGDIRPGALFEVANW